MKQCLGKTCIKQNQYKKKVFMENKSIFEKSSPWGLKIIVIAMFLIAGLFVYCLFLYSNNLRERQKKILAQYEIYTPIEYGDRMVISPTESYLSVMMKNGEKAFVKRTENFFSFQTKPYNKNSLLSKFDNNESQTERGVYLIEEGIYYLKLDITCFEELNILVSADDSQEYIYYFNKEFLSSTGFLKVHLTKEKPMSTIKITNLKTKKEIYSMKIQLLSSAN